MLKDAAGQALYERMLAAPFGMGPGLVQAAARREFGDDAGQIFSDKKRCYLLAYADWTWDQICLVSS